MAAESKATKTRKDKQPSAADGVLKALKSSSEFPPKSPSVDPVMTAVRSLQNNEMKTYVEEGRFGTPKLSITYPPELVAGMRGLFSSSRTYDFQLHASGTIASTGGGVINTRISWDSSVVSYAEWTALAALFDEVKGITAQVDITSAFGPTSTAIITQIMIAPDRDGVSGSAPTYTVTQRLAESEPFHIYLMAGKPGVFTKVHKIGSRPFATTAVPGGASGTPAGMIGQFSVASNIVTTATINCLFWALKTRARFRNRA